MVYFSLPFLVLGGWFEVGGGNRSRGFSRILSPVRSALLLCFFLFVPVVFTSSLSHGGAVVVVVILARRWQLRVLFYIV